MAEEPTFASEVTTEKSESQKIRERIQTYQAGISPNSLQVIAVLLEQQLKAGLVKSTDLEALVMLRDEVNKATIDYRTMMEREQKRLQEITVKEAEEKQIELENTPMVVEKVEETEEKRVEEKIIYDETGMENLKREIERLQKENSRMTEQLAHKEEETKKAVVGEKRVVHVDVDHGDHTHHLDMHGDHIHEVVTSNAPGT